MQNGIFSIEGNVWVNKSVLSQIVNKSPASLDKYFKKIKDKIFKIYLDQGKINFGEDIELVSDFENDFPLKIIEKQIGGGAKTRLYKLQSISNFIKYLDLNINRNEILKTFERLNLLKDQKLESKKILLDLGIDHEHENENFSDNNFSHKTMGKEVKEDLNKNNNDYKEINHKIDNSNSLNEDKKFKDEMMSLFQSLENKNGKNEDNTQIRELLEKQLKEKDELLDKMSSNYEKRLENDKRDFIKRIEDEKKENLDLKNELKVEQSKIEKLILVKDIIDSIKKEYQQLSLKEKNIVKRLSVGEEVGMNEMKQLASGIKKDIQLDLNTFEYKVIEIDNEDEDLKKINDEQIVKLKGDNKIIIYGTSIFSAIILSLIYFILKLKGIL